VMDGYVAITPLRFDLTDRAALSTVAAWNWPASF
jgi:hypothetical protein